MTNIITDNGLRAFAFGVNTATCVAWFYPHEESDMSNTPIADALEESTTLELLAELARLEAENQRLAQQLKFFLDSQPGDDPQAVPAEIHALQANNQRLRAELATHIEWERQVYAAIVNRLKSTTWRSDEWRQLYDNAPEVVRQPASGGQGSEGDQE